MTVGKSHTDERASTGVNSFGFKATTRDWRVISHTVKGNVYEGTTTWCAVKQHGFSSEYILARKVVMAIYGILNDGKKSRHNRA